LPWSSPISSIETVIANSLAGESIRTVTLARVRYMSF
jgi:hypothetical protein